MNGSSRQPSNNRPHYSSSTNWADDEYAQVIEGVKKIYKTKIKPLEVTYNFEGSCVLQFYAMNVYNVFTIKKGFHSAPLTDSDIEAKPMVLLIGQYSTVNMNTIGNIM